MSRSRKMVLMAQQLEEENELINKNNINEQVSNGKATAADHSGSFDGAINQILINNDSENYSEGVKSTILPIHDSEEPPTTYLHNNESLTIESAILPISSSNLHECPPTDEELLKMVDENLTILMNTDSKHSIAMKTQKPAKFLGKTPMCAKMMKVLCQEKDNLKLKL
nr:unnamed protein product [Callosobruchus analis]